MTDLEGRVLAGLKKGGSAHPLELLMSLFEADRDAFYQLATEKPAHSLGAHVRKLADLAHMVRRAVRESYSITENGTGAAMTTVSGVNIAIPADLVVRARHFMRTIDGKQTDPRPGKDYEGTEISRAEARFRLGDETDWAVERDKLNARRDAKPMVLRVSQEDLNHLLIQPAYVTHELLHCVRKTVLAPEHTFKGLKRGNDAPNRLNGGWAFCAKPRKAYHNDGTPFPAPDNMVFVVYADKEQHVFDWDWVKEDPNEPGYPLDRQLRFEDEVAHERDTVIELPKKIQPGSLDPSKACYSSLGDCIFCYVADDEAFAERINSDLTVFRKLGADDFVGFKVKNVLRIVRQDKSVRLADAPGLAVSVDAVLLATLKLHQDASVQVYILLIRALIGIGASPTVRLPEDARKAISAR
ncbi:MAG: hypothetical protein HOP29_08565 [Phycisphaerales bacterium]|nr:hypothetical protein [Phycisphaerales bacterium]